MLKLNTETKAHKTQKVRCPECSGRICDMVIDENSLCRHSYKIITDWSSKSHITIKCRKCGMVVGICLFQI
ncbi:MAG: hypothetical protein OSJ61_10695 [Lachnospiraceae bacterium]|nr:hypothetical protein [Lachnospiraceae bacterium]